MKNRTWLFYALTTTIFWGVWGAFIEIPEKAGFPATLGFVVWALTTIPCSVFALYKTGWKPDTDLRSVLIGCSAGAIGGFGQLVLFMALRKGPAYLVFPIISLYPVLTIILSIIILGERTNRKQWTGIILAILAIFFLANPRLNSDQAGLVWLLMSIFVFIAWGMQAFIMKYANKSMQAESIYLYMSLSSLLISPIAILMTDFSQPINWSFNGPGLAGLIQFLNAVGTLAFVYALRYGKAIVVVPLTGLAPVITIVLSLIIYGVMPGGVLLTGLIFAAIAIVLLSE